MVCDAYQKYINPVADDGDKKHKASDAPKFFSDVLLYTVKMKRHMIGE